MSLIDNKLSSNFRNIGYLPRWYVLLIDIAIVTLIFLITFFIFKDDELFLVTTQNLIFSAPLYIGFNALFFWVFRVYSGIIRHSSFIDALKILVSQISISALVIISYILYFSNTHQEIFSIVGIIFNAVLSYTALFVFRLIVKQLYDYYIHNFSSTNAKNVLIYGSDSNAIAIANALISESPKRFKVVGFIDRNDSKTLTSKRVLNLPIYNLTKKISVLMRFKNARALIIADKSLSNDERLAIVDQCLEYDYKVFTVPIVKNWDDGKEISKSIKSFQIEDLLDRKPILLDKTAISNQIKNKVVLVSGAAGSIGSEIIRQVVLFDPKKVILVDQAESPLHEIRLEIEKMTLNCQVICLVADVRNRELMNEIFKTYKPKVVYHAAAYKHVPLMEENPSQAIFVNVMGTKNLADLAYTYGVDKFVMVSTDKAVNPSNVMGASKRIAEMYVQSLHHYIQNNNEVYKTKYITTRFGNVLGSNGSVVPLFRRQIAAGGPLTITHPEVIRYFMTIPEACQLVLEAGAMGKGGEIYIFDMGKPVKIIDLAKKMIKLAGYTPNKDIMIETIGLRPGEKLYEELLNNTSETLPTHNEKIMIAQDNALEFDAISLKVEDLIKTATTYQSHDIVFKMKGIVPEFKSLNSEFSVLDNK